MEKEPEINMKDHRRDFIKKAFAATASLSFAAILSGFSGNGFSGETNQKQKTMKNLLIKEIQHKGDIDIDLAEQLLENSAEFQYIETINWAEYPYKPRVKFKMAWCQDNILLKYYVTEENILAKETKVNAAVHNDSCVEFFISPQKDGAYYNFEFNCIGTTKVGYGKARANRVLINPKILKRIKTKSSLGNLPFEEKTGGHKWEMMIVIPKACFSHDKDIVLKGLKARANFYKCGDKTSKPHFVTWNPVGTENPDYHQPEYFGKLKFE